MSKKQFALMSAALSVTLIGASRAAVINYNSTASNPWTTGAAWLGGAAPVAGDTAVLGEVSGQLNPYTVTIATSTNQSPSEIRWDSAWYNILSGGTAPFGTLTIPTAGLTLNSISTFTNSLAAAYPSAGKINTVAIVGTGNLNKIGGGAVNLEGTNTFIGDINISGGMLALRTASNNGAGNIANKIYLSNNATLAVEGSNSAINGARKIDIGTGGGTFRMWQAINLTTSDNLLTGSGLLTTTSVTDNAGATFSAGFSTSNPFTGSLRVDRGGFALSGTKGGIGAAAGSYADIAGTLTLSSTAPDSVITGSTSRLGGRSVRARGGNINLTGNATSATTETFGGTSIEQGQTFITVNANAAQPATLDLAALTRNNRGQMFLRGSSLGDASANGVGVISASGVTGLVGGGGTGTFNASILPWAWGNRSATASNDSTFLSYDGTQFIALANSAYDDDLNAAVADSNVNFDGVTGTGVSSGTLTLGAPNKTVNALRINNKVTTAGAQPAMTITGGTIALTSGALLNSSSSPTSPVVTINSDLDAGGAELVVVHTAGSTLATPELTPPPPPPPLNGKLSGSNGFTRAGSGAMQITNTANDYSGVTTFNGGTTILNGSTVSAGSPSVLGTSGDIVINSSGGTNRVLANGALTLNRNLVVNLGGAGTTALGTTGMLATDSVVVNGTTNLNLLTADGASDNRYFSTAGGETVGKAVVFNGVISGAGGLRSSGRSYTVLAASNTYTGGTIIGASPLPMLNNTTIVTVTNPGVGGVVTVIPVTGPVIESETWEIRSSNAFGTGPIQFGNVAAGLSSSVVGALNTTGKIVSGGSSPITLPNNVVLGFWQSRFGGTQPITINGNVDLNGGTIAFQGSMISVDAGSSVTINGSVQRGSLIKNGGGKLTLAGTNTYTNTTLIRDGVLEVANIGNGGVASPGNLSTAPAGLGYLEIQGNSATRNGTLRYTGGTASTSRNIRLQGWGGAIDASGSGPINFTGVIDSPAWFGSAAAPLGIGTSLPAFIGGAQVIPGYPVFGGRILEGATLVSGTGIPVGTTITEVGHNYLRLSNATTAASSGSYVFAAPAGFARNLTLTGNNTGLNTIGGIISNVQPTGIIKAGPGTWNLTAANTYSGGTAVNQGLLLINNTTGSGTGPGAVAVNSGGTLGGNGTISGAITVNLGGTLSPGNSPGKLTTGSTLTLADGSTFVVEITGPTAGTQHDQMVVTAGNTVLGSGGSNQPTLSLPSPSGTGFAALVPVVIINNSGTGTETGTFAGLADGSTVAALTGLGGINQWSIYYNYDVASNALTGGNDVVLLPIPEPTTLGLLGGVALLALRRRSR